MIPYNGEGDDLLVVPVLQHQQPAVPLIRLVPAVTDLVAPLLDINTLPVTAGELVLSTAGELQAGGVGTAVVTGRAVLLYLTPGVPNDGSTGSIAPRQKCTEVT